MGQLVDHNRDADAGEEASDERERQEVGDPAQLRHTNGDQRDARYHRRRGDQHEVLRRLREGEAAEGNREERGDGRVGPDGQNWVRADEGVDQ